MTIWPWQVNQVPSFTTGEVPLDDHFDECAALVILAECNIPPDVQELLVRGDPVRGIPPGSLRKAIAFASKRR